MKRVVIDSSVAVKWLITEELEAEALEILDEWERGIIECVVPDWFFVEVGNILWKKHRNHLITRDEVTSALAELGDLPFLMMPSRPLNDAAVSFAIKYDRTVYDSLYVALAVCRTCGRGRLPVHHFGCPACQRPRAARSQCRQTVRLEAVAADESPARHNRVSVKD